MYSLYGAGSLILIRSLFRVAEFVGGTDGPIMTHEAYIYVFDGVLMLGAMVIFNVVHPGAIIGRKAGSDGIRLDERESSTDALAYERK